ncbi:cobalt-precorrin 5A hydrolase [Brassicibacter mesophilus]|uniref:cobalt-precorrin 5A hydrolase n=1 Tax=Brassicibacter mesophilus TaxID=745119 RepID=UPI003D25A17F
MRWAVLTLTKGGLEQAKRIKSIISEVDIYTLPKWKESQVFEIEGRLEDFVGSIFDKYSTLIFIMATGIVVRTIATHIKHKAIDPAILVMDEKGEFVISLLSGHLGGANNAARLLGEKIGAKPVITTASDVNDSMAVDTIAMKLNCVLDNFDEAKNITALIVNKEKVGIKSDIPISFNLPENIVKANDDCKDIKGVIYITNKKEFSFFSSKVQIIPKNIVVGIGCRKGIQKDHIVEAVNKFLDINNIHPKSIRHFATVDIKQNEQGIIEASRYFNVPLKIISREQIKKVEESFETSDFVKKTIGVGAVCEPCAYLSSTKGHFIMRKTSAQGVTVCLLEENIYE